MSDSIKELVEIPQAFVKEGTHTGMLRNYLPTSRAGRGRAEAALGLIVEATTRTTSTHASYLFACRADPQFLNRCTKPTKAEYIQLCRAVGVGFLVMGFIGYIVKVVHLPINNILVGGA
ncbi:SSS1-ER protein-translocase complex subunit [Trichosporon asahii var. asahii CBS 2479]|uniref:SSS1-ER protein-translocase complex subunit n=1 Tax=Trichosporon asahii var. asahii (strain ATCC 90039 / CBS 2479 / JCM 2466 / KCTC 7840 / NBRC 103889/ NCYC 2677 / UAMH 7654) TaxID=1186058 RepID=J8TZV5_TRIAS|nr:SSS1-ER protein-translocase complex subunit [Trichosporon asahii var. asahii CBS 2479]EJT53280.1 SSS1-ER protein-translocase complex subunit [Trichosporon asahii var. asahii CBS 2479]